MDLGGYDAYFSGKLVDYPLPEDEMKKSLESIEGLPKPKKMKGGKALPEDEMKKSLESIEGLPKPKKMKGGKEI
jgi:hypothetical protein